MPAGACLKRSDISRRLLPEDLLALAPRDRPRSVGHRLVPFALVKIVMPDTSRPLPRPGDGGGPIKVAVQADCFCEGMQFIFGVGRQPAGCGLAAAAGYR